MATAVEGRSATHALFICNRLPCATARTPSSGVPSRFSYRSVSADWTCRLQPLVTFCALASLTGSTPVSAPYVFTFLFYFLSFLPWHCLAAAVASAQLKCPTLPAIVVHLSCCLAWALISVRHYHLFASCALIIYIPLIDAVGIVAQFLLLRVLEMRRAIAC